MNNPFIIDAFLFAVFLQFHANIFFESFPCIGMLHKIFRTDFSRHIVMPYQILFRKIKFDAQISTQLYQSGLCLRGKFPIFLFMAALNGNRIGISIVLGISHLFQWNTLYNCTVQSNDKMTAGIRFLLFPFICLWQIVKIIAICHRIHSGIRCIVYDDGVNLLQCQLWS